MRGPFLPHSLHQLLSLTGRLHGTIVGPTGRSDPGYARLSVRPFRQTGRTDCSRTAHICPSNQCGLLADYNTAYTAAWLVDRLASRSDQSDVVSTRFDSRIGSRTDQSDRPVGPTIGASKRPVTRQKPTTGVREFWVPVSTGGSRLPELQLMGEINRAFSNAKFS